MMKASVSTSPSASVSVSHQQASAGLVEFGRPSGGMLPLTPDAVRPAPAVQPAPSPPPAKPPGEAFAAAVLAGQLPPRPTTEMELERRLAGLERPDNPTAPTTNRLA